LDEMKCVDKGRVNDLTGVEKELSKDGMELTVGESKSSVFLHGWLALDGSLGRVNRNLHFIALQ
jgi:hypothetical protein